MLRHLLSLVFLSYQDQSIPLLNMNQILLNLILSTGQKKRKMHALQKLSTLFNVVIVRLKTN